MLKKLIVIISFSIYSAACYSSDNNYAANVVCHYQKTSDVTNPESEKINAEDASGKPVVIQGYNSGYDDRYIFITDSELPSLYQLCEDTLQRKDIKGRALFVNSKQDIFEPYLNIWSTYKEHAEKKSVINNIERIVSFGDSLSDTNNAFSKLYYSIPNRKSWFWGHFSNGNVWTEYLSESLKAPLFNWSVGAASTINDDLKPGSDFSAQIARFFGQTSRDENYDIKKTLFTVLFGANDIRFGKDVVSSVNALYSGVEILISKGAKNIVVMTLPDLSVAPDYVNKDAEKERVREQIIIYNKELKKMVSKLESENHNGVSIHLIELNLAFSDIINHPEKYNMKNVKESCLDMEKGAVEYVSVFHPRESCVKDPRFVFWDLVHPTSAVHKILANEVERKILAIYK